MTSFGCCRLVVPQTGLALSVLPTALPPCHLSVPFSSLDFLLAPSVPWWQLDFASGLGFAATPWGLHPPRLSGCHPPLALRHTCMSALSILIASIRTVAISLRALAFSLEASADRAEHQSQVPDSLFSRGTSVSLDPGWDRISSTPTEPARSSSAGSGHKYKSYDEVARSLIGAPPAAFEYSKRLSGTDTFIKQRVQRAWEAGLWAKAVLAGDLPKPRPTPPVSLKPTVFIVLRGPGVHEPVAVGSAAEYYQILPRFTPDSLYHSFPSISETKIYCLAAGVPFPAYLQ